APPGELGRPGVVAGRGVVAEAVAGAGLDVDLVGCAGSRARLLERRPHRADALVLLGVVDELRRRDLRHVGRVRRRTVARHARGQVAAHAHCGLVGHAAAPAEAGGAEPAGGALVLLEPAGAVQHVLPELLGVEARLHRTPVVVVAGITADR